MYVTTISIPIVFDAFDDVEARARLEELLTHFALDGVTLGALRDKFSAEVSDAPTADGLEESLPYEPLRTVEIGSNLDPRLDNERKD